MCAYALASKLFPTKRGARNGLVLSRLWSVLREEKIAKGFTGINVGRHCVLLPTTTRWLLGGLFNHSTALRNMSRSMTVHVQTRNFSNDKDQKQSDSPPPEEAPTWFKALPLVGGLVLMYFLLRNPEKNIPSIPLSFFLKEMLQKGEVEKLVVSPSHEKVYIFLHHGAIINGSYVHPRGPQFIMSIAGVDSFESKLDQVQNELNISPQNRVTVQYKSQPSGLEAVLTLVSILAIFGVASYFLIRLGLKRGRRDSLGRPIDKKGKLVDSKFLDILDGKESPRSFFNPFSFMTQAKTTIITDPSQIKTSFKDVAGMEEAKREIMEFVDYLKSPERFLDLGARIPKGALLYGPPGTGKTLLARAIAGEAHVPFISIAGSDFVEVYAGVGAARVRDLFTQARKNAPCILYVDEVDAVGRSRKSGSNFGGSSEQETTLNQLLVEMDGIAPLNSVVVLASTNRVDILDKALLRPGRFDRQVAIDLPTLPERKAIFEVYLKNIVLEKNVQDYSSRLAALTPGHSGADIANIVNEAALHSARDKGTFVGERNFEYAIERVIAGMEKKTSSLGSEEREVIAYHEAGHALLGWLLEHTDPVMKVSIVPRTRGPLGFSQSLPSDQVLQNTEQLFDRMTMRLGGRAAEAITFHKITTGAQDDLSRVTDMAYRQIAEYGMSPTIGHISLPITKSTELTKRLYSNKLAKLIDDEAKILVNSAYARAETILRENEENLKKLAQALLEHEVLNFKDLSNILGPMPHSKDHIRFKDHLDNMW